MRDPVTYVLFSRKTILIPFRYVYPECLQLIERYDRVYPLLCLKSDQCPANKNCMSTLAHRVNYLFTELEPQAELVVAYFKYRDTNVVRAGVFDRELAEPKLMRIHPDGLKSLLPKGVTKQWFPSDTYWRSSTGPAIIPAESLIKKAP